MIKSKMGKCIQLAMTKAGISGEALAKTLGVTPTTVSRWRKECGDLDTLELVADQCGYTIDELIKLAD